MIVAIVVIGRAVRTRGRRLLVQVAMNDRGPRRADLVQMLRRQRAQERERQQARG